MKFKYMLTVLFVLLFTEVCFGADTVLKNYPVAVASPNYNDISVSITTTGISDSKVPEFIVTLYHGNQLTYVISEIIHIDVGIIKFVFNNKIIYYSGDFMLTEK